MTKIKTFFYTLNFEFELSFELCDLNLLYYLATYYFLLTTDLIAVD